MRFFIIFWTKNDQKWPQNVPQKSLNLVRDFLKNEKNAPGTFADAGLVPKRAPESILEPPGVHVGASGVDF